MVAESTPTKKSNQVAFMLSGILPGLGQFYNNDGVKGAVFFFGSMIFEGIVLPENYFDILMGRVPFSTELLGRILLASAVRVGSVYDADRSARRKNAAAVAPLRVPSKRP